MWKYTAEVDGMMCGMCEAHMNDAIRLAYNVKKVSSSHSKGTTTFFTEDEVTEDSLRKVVTSLGYDMGAFKKEEAVKKGFFWK